MLCISSGHPRLGWTYFGSPFPFCDGAAVPYTGETGMPMYPFIAAVIPTFDAIPAWFKGTQTPC